MKRVTLNVIAVIVALVLTSRANSATWPIALNASALISPETTHSDHVQSSADHCSLRSQSVAKFAHPALTKQPGPRHPWRVRSSALEPVAPKRALSPGKYYVTDEASKNRSWTFDLQGRVLTEVTPDGTETRTYNDLTRTWEALNRRSFKTLYEADAMGRVTEITHPNTSTELFTYDANGNRTSAKDRVGTITKTTFDVLDRELTSKRGDRTQTRTLDQEGHVLTETVTTATPAATRSTSYTYDMTLPSPQKVSGLTGVCGRGEGTV